MKEKQPKREKKISTPILFGHYLHVWSFIGFIDFTTIPRNTVIMKNEYTTVQKFGVSKVWI